MTQNASDVEIANQGFAAFRQDLNDVLEDITTLHSGDTAPTTTYANQFWYETDTDKLYIRNEDNDAWIEILTLDQANDHLATLGASITLDGTGNVSIDSGDFTVDTSTLHVDSTNNRVGIGTSSPSTLIEAKDTTPTLRLTDDRDITWSGNEELGKIEFYSSDSSGIGTHTVSFIKSINDYGGASQLQGALTFGTADYNTAATERMRIDGSGDMHVGKTSGSFSVDGVSINGDGYSWFVSSVGSVLDLKRRTSDGRLIGFYQSTALEGSISVSGTTVSYNGGHLARWSQLTNGTKDETITKGTVMTNLDQMAAWSHDAVEAVEAQDAVYDDDGNVVNEPVKAVEAQDAYTEDNEQLNCMAVSSVEGDPNVAGVFVNWDNDDDEFNDMNIAMTGDMVIRIAQGTTVARGDLLMSAGDGTAKPQGDDIVRSKTIAKVTSTNVSHTYDDGSYLVPCVLMAC